MYWISLWHSLIPSQAHFFLFILSSISVVCFSTHLQRPAHRGSPIDFIFIHEIIDAIVPRIFRRSPNMIIHCWAKSRVPPNTKRTSWAPIGIAIRSRFNDEMNCGRTWLTLLPTQISWQSNALSIFYIFSTGTGYGVRTLSIIRIGQRFSKSFPSFLSSFVVLFQIKVLESILRTVQRCVLLGGRDGIFNSEPYPNTTHSTQLTLSRNANRRECFGIFVVFDYGFSVVVRTAYSVYGMSYIVG